MTRLQDVAKAAKVSIQTASCILNNRGHLYKDTTRKKVLDAAERLGYRPNMLARGLRGGKTQTLGLMLSGLISSTPSNMKLRSIERAARDHGYRLLLGTYDDDADRLDDHVRDFLGLSVDGLIYWASAVKDARALKRVREAKKPIVLIEPPDRFGLPTVDVDRALGGYMQIKHLHQIGRRKIAYLLTTFGNFRSQAKIQGIRKALAEDDAQMDSDLTLTRNTIKYEPAYTGKELISQLLDAGKRFDAVVTLSDGIALGVLSELRQRGIRVPDDVAVIGYDNDVFAGYTAVPLTTIHQPRDVGSHALPMLVDQIEGRSAADEPPYVNLEPELIVRDSTVPGAASTPGPAGDPS